MKYEAENYEVIFGSNLIQECGKVVELVGKGINKQIIRFRVGEDGKVLFNCSVKDESGTTIAKVANSKVQHLRQGFKADISSNTIKIWNETAGDVLLEFAQLGPRKFKLNGFFYLPGYRIVANDDYLDVNGIRMSKNVFRNCSTAIGLGLINR